MVPDFRDLWAILKKGPQRQYSQKYCLYLEPHQRGAVTVIEKLVQEGVIWVHGELG